MKIVNSPCRVAAVAAVILCGPVLRAGAQTASADIRIVDVDGHKTRVWTAGLHSRGAGQPVVILEAGAGEGLDTWKPAFAEIARVAPVVAYDRRGIGQSAPDSAKPTLRRVAQSLHALLGRLNVPPPFVLVGHSWGGLLVRAYTDQYPGEVAGLVFLDALNPGTTREERAKGLPEEQRKEILAPPTLPAIPPDTPAGLRAEYEVVGSEMVNDYPEARSLRLPSGVPVAMIKAMPPGRLKSSGPDLLQRGENRLEELAVTSPKGLAIVATHVGHMVHRDDPGLVAWVIQHVVKHAAVSKPVK